MRLLREIVGNKILDLKSREVDLFPGYYHSHHASCNNHVETYKFISICYLV